MPFGVHYGLLDQEDLDNAYPTDAAGAQEKIRVFYGNTLAQFKFYMKGIGSGGN